MTSETSKMTIGRLVVSIAVVACLAIPAEACGPSSSTRAVSSGSTDASSPANGVAGGTADGGNPGSDASGGDGLVGEPPGILNRCHAVFECTAYTGTKTLIYEGDIEVVPYSPHSCATAMVSSNDQRHGELFLALEFSDNHSVIDHGQTVPNPPTAPWSGDVQKLSFGWNGQSFNCIKDDPARLNCTHSHNPCVTFALCCSGSCTSDSTGTAVCL